MDQIFDRLERLFKSWVSQESDEFGRSPRRGSGDPDLDSAMDELDDFLAGDREEAERRARERAEREARAGAGSARPSGPDPRLVDAYAYLGLPFGTPFPEVRAKYKKLLLKHHPDRHSASPENLKKATETSARINDAYNLIEAWVTTGKPPE